MTKDQGPPDGLPYKEALRKLVDLSLWTELERARAAAPRAPRRGFFPIDGGFRDAARRAQVHQDQELAHNYKAAWNAILSEFWGRVRSGEIIAFGYLNAVPAVGLRQEIARENWEHVRLKKGEPSSFEGGGQTWWRVLFYPRETVEEWRASQERRRKGLALGESVKEYADARLSEESDHYGGYDREWRSRPPSYVFFTEGPLPPEAKAVDRRERLWFDMEEHLWRQLENGELALWGYPHPLSPKSRRVRVATHLIPLLKPNFENSTAEGGKLSLEDARVYPRDVMPGDAEIGDEAPEIPSEARPADATPVGRPSRVNEIDDAYDDLEERGEIDDKLPQKRARRQVREEVMRRAGNRDPTGLEEEVIRRCITKKFQALIRRKRITVKVQAGKRK